MMGVGELSHSADSDARRVPACVVQDFHFGELHETGIVDAICLRRESHARPLWPTHPALRSSDDEFKINTIVN